MSPNSVAPIAGIKILDDFTAISIVAARDDSEATVVAEVINPLAFPKFDYELAEYKVALFTHRSWPEARVLQLKFNGARIGILFSLQALATEESVLPSEQVWNEYAFIALQKICLGEFDYGPDELPAPSLKPSPITEVLSDNTIVLVLDRSSCLRGMLPDDYSTLIERCLPSLAKYGFYRLDKESRPGDFRANALALDPQQSSLMLRPYSESLPKDAATFFGEILLRSAQREQNPTFRLFLGYQMIEILLSDLYGRIIKAFAVKAASAQTTIELRELNESLINATKEHNRIGSVFNSNRCPDTNQAFDDLLSSCSTMLSCLDNSAATGSTNPKNVESALYIVRNHIFHNFSKVSALETEIEEVAQHLFILLCDLAIFYKTPPNAGI